MALKSDSQGFLIGEVVSDLRRNNDQLNGIRADVRDIKSALLGATSKSSKNTKIDGGAKIAAPISRRDNGASKVATPAMSKGASVLPPAPKKAATPNGRDASTGKFTAKSAAAGGDTPTPNIDEKKSQSIISNLANRITSTAAGAAAGAEEADPAIKAIKEVSEPMMRGYQTLFGGGDKKERWFQKIWKELNLFRKDESVFNKAEAKVLKNISEKPGGGGEESPGFLGGLMGSISPLVMTAITGVGGALLTGVTAVLGAIFSPIGLAIAAAGAVAWGLFSEDGQKFFGEVGAKIIAGWDKAVDWFVKSSPKTMELLNKGLDKTNEAIDAVVDSSPKTVAAVKNGVDAAKDLGGKATDAIAKSSPKTTAALGNAWDKTKEGAGKIVAHATDPDNAKAAMKVLMDKGWTKEQAAGIAANLSAESGFDTKAVGDGGKAKGIAQWHPDRQKKFEEVNGKKLSDASLEEQVGFVDWELRNTEKKAGDKIRTATTSKQAAAFTEQSYERSALGAKGGVQQERIDKATKYANLNIAEDAKPTETTNIKQSVIEPAALPELPVAMTETVGAINAKTTSISDDPTQAGRYKYETLEGGKVQVTDNESGTIEFASEEQANAYRRQQGKPYLDSLAAANNPDSYSTGGVFSKSPALHDFAAGPRNTTQTAYAAVPKIPTFSPVSAPAEAPPVKQYLASNSDRTTTAAAPSIDVGQDINDRNIAHIATGGFSRRG